jgi:CheY-like chemotaxis protein
MKRNDANARRPVRPSLPYEPRKELVLYVEDDDDNWEIAELRLSKNFELIRAVNDEQACRLLRDRRGEIDVVLMDIELRGSELNGVELTEPMRGNELRSRSSLPAYARALAPLSKPVVYVTAHGARYGGVALSLTGADKVITKPVDFAALSLSLFELSQERTAV